MQQVLFDLKAQQAACQQAQQHHQRIKRAASQAKYVERMQHYLDSGDWKPWLEQQSS